MRLLLDEMMSPTAAGALDVLARGQEAECGHILDLARPGRTDDEIAELCRTEGIAALVTLNIRDFGAKKHYFAALLDAGIHVIVIRPAKQQPDAGQQVAIVAEHLDGILSRLAGAGSPVLIKVTRGGVVERSLDALIAEASGLP